MSWNSDHNIFCLQSSKKILNGLTLTHWYRRSLQQHRCTTSPTKHAHDKYHFSMQIVISTLNWYKQTNKQIRDSNSIVNVKMTCCGYNDNMLIVNECYETWNYARLSTCLCYHLSFLCKHYLPKRYLQCWYDTSRSAGR